MDNLVLTTAVLAGLLLLAMRRFRFQPGQAFALFGVPAVAGHADLQAGSG